MGSETDRAWRRALCVALFLIAGLTASAAPRFPFWAPGSAAAAPGSATRATQISDDPNADDPDDEDEDDADDQNIPVFEDDPKPTPVDSTAAPTGARPDSTARPDSAAMLPVTPESAEPETLRYVPPGEAAPRAARPGDEPVAPVKKPKQGIFGIPPIVLILGLTAAHVFVVKAVTD